MLGVILAGIIMSIGSKMVSAFGLLGLLILIAIILLIVIFGIFLKGKR